MDNSMENQKNQCNETVNLSVDEAWKLKRYDHVLSLLKNDSYYPDEFDIKKLNEKDKDQRLLKAFAKDRILFHKSIKEGDLGKVKNYTLKNKAKYYFNEDGDTAASTAIGSRRFGIYAYLLSINAGLEQNELKEVDELTTMEKDELRKNVQRYFCTSKYSHIYYLMSKIQIRSKNPFEKDKKDLFGYLKTLNRIEEVSIILKVVQYVENLELVLDLDCENVKIVCPLASEAERGYTLPHQKSIYVAAGSGRLENEILGTMAHELTHMAMELIFRNNCNPYFETKSDKRGKFQELVEKKQNIEKKQDTPSETFKDAYSSFYFKTGQVQSEVIARIPHILAQYDDGKDWLENNAFELFHFYLDEIIPECEKFIEKSFLLKSRSLNRAMNESEGEIVNIRKCGLIFNDVGKIKSFLSDERKKIFGLITNYTWMGLLRALQGIYGANYIESYDNFLVFKLKNCIKNVGEVKYVFSSEATEILIIECPDTIRKEYKTSEGLADLSRIVKTKAQKKIIFILKDKKNKNLIKILEREKMNELYKEETDEDFSLCDLDRKCQNYILEKGVLFQKEEITLGELIGEDEDLLKCVNANVIQDILENKEIEIGKKLLGSSSLEGAYADIYHEINVDALIHEIKKGEDIFIMNGEDAQDQKSKIIECLGNDFDMEELSDYEHEIKSDKKIFLIKDNMTDKHFYKFCCYNSDKKIYWINIRNEKDKLLFILLKFYNPDFYFPRQFKFFDKVVVQEKVLKEFTDGIIIIIKDKVEKNVLTDDDSKNVMWLDLENSIVTFERLCESSKNVHLIKYEDGKLIWIKSNAPLNSLQPWINQNLNEGKEFNEKELIENIKENKVVIFADDPGMGKSTSLTKLCEIIKLSHDTYWVIRINLKDHLIGIRNLDENLNVNKIATFIKEIDPSLQKEIGKKLLESALDTNKNFHISLLIAFDGFDELLDENDRMKVIALLKFLKYETRCKIWITTRLHFKEILLLELSTFAVRFMPINDTSKIIFIKAYWKSRLRLILNKEKFSELFENEEMKEGSVLRTCIMGFINKTKSVFRENIARCIGTPLQLHLLLEGSINFFLEWAENPEIDPDFQYLGNDLIDVYKKYIDRKYEIFFRKKNILEETVMSAMRDLIEKSHEELAKSLVMKKDDEEEFSKNKSKNTSLILLFGITAIQSDYLQFIHFTFQEYFFAQLLIKNFLHYPYSVKIENLTNFFMKKVLVKYQYIFIRSFLNEYFKNNKITESFKNCQEFAKAVRLLSEGDFTHKCGICISIKEAHNNMLEFLFSLELLNFDWYSFLLHDNRLCGSKPLHLTIERKNKFAFDLIIDMLPKYCVEEHQYFKILSIVDVFKRTVLYLAVEEEEQYYFFDRLMNVLKKCSKEEKKNLLNSFSILGGEETVMYSAVRKFNDPAVNRLIEALSEYSLDEQYDFLCHSYVLDCTVLHLATEVKNKYALNRLIEMVSKFSLDEQFKLIRIQDLTDQTVFHVAAQEKNDAAFDKFIEILSKIDGDEQFKFLSTVTEFRQTIFHTAVETCNVHALTGLFKLISKYSPDKQYELLNIVSSRGWLSPEIRGTILHSAVLRKNDAILNLIIQKLSDFSLEKQYEFLRIGNYDGDTVLHSAVEGQNFSFLNRFNEMASRFTLNKQYEFLCTVNGDGQTVFHVALETKNNDVLKKLVDNALNYSLDKQYELFSIVSRFGRTTIKGIGGTVLHFSVLKRNYFALNLFTEWLLKFSKEEQYDFLSIVNAERLTALSLAVGIKNKLAVNRFTEMASKFSSGKKRKFLKEFDARQKIDHLIDDEEIDEEEKEVNVDFAVRPFISPLNPTFLKKLNALQSMGQAIDAMEEMFEEEIEEVKDDSIVYLMKVLFSEDFDALQLIGRFVDEMEGIDEEINEEVDDFAVKRTDSGMKNKFKKELDALQRIDCLVHEKEEILTREEEKKLINNRFIVYFFVILFINYLFAEYLSKI